MTDRETVAMLMKRRSVATRFRKQLTTCMQDFLLPHDVVTAILTMKNDYDLSTSGHA